MKREYMEKSHILVAVARNAKVRILLANTTELCEEARKTHDLYPTSAAALGRVLSVGVLMGSMLKRADEKIDIQINGGGPIGTIMVEAYGDGRVKGFCGDNEIYLKYNSNNKLAVGLAVGTDGYLKVSKNMGLKNIFTSQVALQTGEIGDDFAYYYAVSEQVPSLVSVGVLVNPDYSICAAGSIIIQLMPNHTEEDIEYVETIQKQLKPVSTLINEGHSLEEILHSLFEDGKVLEERDVYFGCDCSKERFMKGLLTLNKKDLDEILEDETIEVKCEFCNKTYEISSSDVAKMMNEHVEN